MQYFPILFLLFLSYTLTAQLTDIHYTNYELVEVTTEYGFYYKLQAPIPTTSNKSLYPLQVLLENRSAIALKVVDGKTFYLKVLCDGKEKELEIPNVKLSMDSSKTYTLMIEAQQRPVVISGSERIKK